MQRIKWREFGESLCDAPLNEVEPAQIAPNHPARQFWQYWLEIGQGQIPHRQAFSPAAVKSLLKWIMLFQLEQEQDRDLFRLVLQGTSAVELTHGQLTGQYLHQFTSGACYPGRLVMMETALANQTPTFGRTMQASTSGINTSMHVGAFPFRTETLPQIFIVPAPIDNSLRALL